MPRTLTQTLKQTCAKHAKRIVFRSAVVFMMAVGVAAQCGDRRSFHHSTTLYGGRQFDTFVSCGSSAGNFAYTCAEGGLCYIDTSVDADAECGCSSGPTQ